MELRRSCTGGHTLTHYDLRDLLKDPNNIAHWTWENVYMLAQLAQWGYGLWKCGPKALNIAAEVCRMHPDLEEVVRVLRRAHEGARVPPQETGKEET